MNVSALLEPINQFLQCPTPQGWIDEAVKPENLSTLLVDHANCELKAAQTAMLLLRRYAVDKQSGEALLAWLKPFEDFVYRKVGSGDFSQHIGLSKKLISRSEFAQSDQLINKMVLLIKEELHHFQQCWEIMQGRGIEYANLTASRYARGMMKHVRTHEPAKLIDTLICGAYIEARSCERFAMLAPHLDDELEQFYISLLRSEARHFQDYLALAQQVSDADITDRVRFYGEREALLISAPDQELRFHSGPLAATVVPAA
ncbi:tRNA isopentenyl-2-thiomethyl-A-37 hydroxylase MiaE [Alteromonas oceanisediminis]|uniref:tRNA isopentenyl-2-thiomethyl-A-37 hydroxylase MiaE n=1 Tax=Alteromonas oceanisediminis TaxID=2836180 RepID=UPI001BD972C2|nr:tRNA isopentenyl-2-thiomethyl-A-37 hydroxylase MiaE [Alteromonas oceanisediminis]MBT0587404.1 tRNA isopentenyl-2-thiomethyl-A-37 hydroxylase MiaE [Alteromonas oceanisediminis]